MFTPLLLLVAAALAGPLHIELSAKEVTQLEAGEVIVRSPTDDGMLVGAIDIPGESGPVWDAVMNFDARVQNVGAIRSISTYAPGTDPKGLGERFELSVMGVSVVYHLRYQEDPQHQWVTFGLDTERENDLVSSTGGYHIIPQGEGQRLLYWSRTDVGRSIPGFIRNALSNRSFRNQLSAMRRLAGGTE
jgi:hypothetical protein